MLLFFSPDDPNCPVLLYKLYASKRPESMRDSISRFYLSLNKNYGETSDQWYSSQPMGKNTLSSLARTMSTKAGFSARHTNHSARKTSITNLLDAEVPATEVAQLSGHKNLMSLNHYNTVSLEKQIKMSTVVHSASGTGNNRANGVTMNTDSDEELLTASQELELGFTLNAIENYENINQISNAVQPTFAESSANVPSTSNSGINAQPDQHSAPGVSPFPVPNIPLFSYCTFSCPVNIVFKH